MRKAPPGCYWRQGVLYARVVVRGKDIRWSLETDEPKIARRAREAGKARLLALKRGDDRLLFADLHAQWATWIIDQVAAATVIRYTVSLDRLEPFLAGKYHDQIDGRLVTEIIDARKKNDGVTNATIKRDLVALSSVMNFAIDRGYREENPILPRLKRVRERRDPIVLPREEDVAKLIAAAPGMLADLICAARVTGARLEELAGASHAQLDLAAGRLTLRGKRNRTRVIDLSPFDGIALFARLPPGIAKAPLFWHGAGKRYANVSSRVARIALDISARDQEFIRFRFHDLRHLHAVEWLRSGRTIYDLQHRLGHSSIKTTEVYTTHLTADEHRRIKQG